MELLWLTEIYYKFQGGVSFLQLWLNPWTFSRYLKSAMTIWSPPDAPLVQFSLQ